MKQVSYSNHQWLTDEHHYHSHDSNQTKNLVYQPHSVHCVLCLCNVQGWHYPNHVSHWAAAHESQHIQILKFNQQWLMIRRLIIIVHTNINNPVIQYLLHNTWSIHSNTLIDQTLSTVHYATALSLAIACSLFFMFYIWGFKPAMRLSVLCANSVN